MHMHTVSAKPAANVVMFKMYLRLHKKLYDRVV